MWLIFSVVVVSIGLLMNSYEISVKKREKYKSTIGRFIVDLVVQIFISSIVVIVSVYLIINLVEINEVRDSTSNSKDFWDSVLKGILYVLGLFLVWTSYFKQSSEHR